MGNESRSAATAGRSPGFAKNPGHSVELEISPRRVRVDFNGETIADSTRPRLLFETGLTPTYYFPLDDIRDEFLQRSDLSTNCPYKGDASYWSIAVGDRTAENAMWSYETPYDEKPELRELAAFFWGRMDHWYEEDEEIFVHPRDPYKRVDTVLSHRPVRVVVGGETVAESTNAHFLFETGLPTRYYLPPEDVRMDLLAESELRTECPYKGEAIYWSVTVDGITHRDVVWSYPNPIAECPKIRDLMCFYNENVDAIFVDGVELVKPRTKWSNE